MDSTVHLMREDAPLYDYAVPSEDGEGWTVRSGPIWLAEGTRVVVCGLVAEVTSGPYDGARFFLGTGDSIP